MKMKSRDSNVVGWVAANVIKDRSVEKILFQTSYDEAVKKFLPQSEIDSGTQETINTTYAHIETTVQTQIVSTLVKCISQYDQAVEDKQCFKDMTEMTLLDQMDAAGTEMVIEVNNQIEDMDVENDDRELFAKLKLFLAKEEETKSKQSKNQLKDHRGARKEKGKKKPNSSASTKKKNQERKGNKNSDGDKENATGKGKKKNQKGKQRKQKENGKK